ncbi:DUF7839 domain-containing protein [Halegenticoccus tardaugens]|uniref:DUF7839 domain-containing protein n=1 Tax=Halegenticoccus tardaugens TaxID=2071624 RepID=UPI00100A7072|nr:winged helix-turn-helix transcriptional regulator [Halegenticoccus tardaugens]
MPPEDREPDVLRSKRDATSYQILVELAERQPAVSQREVADAVGITAQAVSEYVRALVDRGYVETSGRGRYEVTKEGIDWLISRTEDLRRFTDYVSTEVVGEVEIETALAGESIEEGETVSLSMRDGALHATPGGGPGATAVAVTDADAGRDVGVSDFEGLLDFDPGSVTVIVVPGVRDGGSAALAPGALREQLERHDLLAAAGVEALAAARAANREPDVHFATAPAVAEAATRGLRVLLLVAAGDLPAHADQLRERHVAYEVLDAADLDG